MQEAGRAGRDRKPACCLFNNDSTLTSALLD